MPPIRRATLKRGGGVEFVSWECDLMAEDALAWVNLGSRARCAAHPERLFDLPLGCDGGG